LDLKGLDKKLGKGNNIVIFNLEHNIEAMFYTNYTIYKDLPKTTQLQRLLNNGFRIIINDDGSIPEKTRRIEGLEFIRLSTTQSQ
jgi:hypothetical protein